ncbi:hypothetical protein BCR33DRAFT_779996 [Rhizoclosmatium globosum]|uniref:RGS domain-containing protein n=1 Tax=Rhizoclosmatium globosum TaxID=329046 RepID=A0A1Y2CXR2_9FUNG|nr:hypothetical protein BCR33DRAFT_779996 [Rhizoclosmatium globosum]|eukprot:ORY51822.1 hypothetical protein BCR33DRAFT_779996 [Rhizoclosmatium globosum]
MNTDVPIPDVLTTSGNTIPRTPMGDYERHQRVLHKRHERITGHLDCFTRIKVIVDRPSLSFYVVADRRNTIEYFMRQIEAEYAYKFLVPVTEGSDQLLPTATNVIPLECGELCNSESIPLKYEDTIGVSLDAKPVVQIVNVFEASMETETRKEVAESMAISGKTSPRLEVQGSLQLPSASTPGSDSGESPNSNFGSTDRKKSVISIFNVEVPLPTEPLPQLDEVSLFEMMHNKKGLEALYTFCLSDFTIENLLFWMDVQVFRSCPEASRSQFGGYIYNMYLVADAPVKVNVSLDLMYDINAAIVSQVAVDVGMFDDAQQHIYSLLKMKTYARFKKSKAFETFLTFKSRYEVVYKANSFPPTMFYETFRFTKLPLFHEDAPSTKSIQLQSQEEKEIFKDLVIERVLRRYFTDCKFFETHGYFADPDRSQLLQRAQKQKMEKKITKFFGQRPAADELGRQKQMIDSLKQAVVHTQVEDAAHLGSMMEEALGIRKSRTSRTRMSKSGAANTSGSSVGGTSSSQLEDNEMQLKKKKFEKLIDFFGEPIPREERKNFMDEDSMLQLQDGSMLKNENEEEAAEVVDTVNDLTPDEKARLTKKARKLMTVFGEHGAQQTFVSRDARQSLGGARGSFSSAGAGSGLSSGPASIVGMPSQDSSLLSLSQSLIPEDEETVLDPQQTMKVELSEEEFREIKMLRKKRLSKLTAFLGEEVGTLETSLSAGTGAGGVGAMAEETKHLSKEEKVVQRKRIQKLERMMGELVTTDILDHALDVSEELDSSRRVSNPAPYQKVAASPSKNRPVTVIGFEIDRMKIKELAAARLDEEDETAQQVSSFDASLPVLPKKELGAKHHQNLVALTELLQQGQTDKALDLMDSMLKFDADEFNMIKNKDLRKKKLKKLRKFFGNNLNPVQMFEQDVVAELELMIKDEVTDPSELKMLNDDLVKVRTQVALHVNDLQTGWAARKARE